jgi:RNA polymerase sigma factor (sigma-70 family)
MVSERNTKIEETIKKERHKLFNFIKKNVSIEEDAEDILQDVLYQFTAAFDDIEYFERISSWLFQTARNKIIDLYRKKKPISINYQLPEDDSDEETLSLADILPDLSSNPDRVYLQDLIWEEIRDALEELPEEQKDVFEMNEFEQMSFKEISELTKIPVNTLLSRKRYAVLYLRKKLKNIHKEIQQ